ncbi:unnamed protein product [Mycetohabitans rhizoxinica HKI 454]|uniref:Uncharacterized protein n=1 Tax=Mycetohabitans rhizoxinica (strain DSM 19002 / CIP 109453 / HKI 454) TaxID=882378 RepID=E5ARF0_MYCRK|nr:unnamed protein product [Mycetohabitans rhizoxinica HKI 454]
MPPRGGRVTVIVHWWPVDALGHDFDIADMPRYMRDQRRDPQRTIRHLNALSVIWHSNGAHRAFPDVFRFISTNVGDGIVVPTARQGSASGRGTIYNRG